jgi:hypothetical protein
MIFTNEMWHPNSKLNKFFVDLIWFPVYRNGEVCISILHPPGEDPTHYEKITERWSPVQSVEKILVSVMSMIAEPNDESPANIEAAVRNTTHLICSRQLIAYLHIILRKCGGQIEKHTAKRYKRQCENPLASRTSMLHPSRINICKSTRDLWW